ncbi:hypothetical protein MTR67_002410, partial [Solanum verrucosum]
GLRNKTWTLLSKKEQGNTKNKEKKACVPSPEGENQVSDGKEQSACRRMVPRCSAISPKVTKLKDAEGQGKRAMKLTKGRIAESIIDPALLRRLVLRNTFFGNYKYLFEFLV